MIIIITRSIVAVIVIFRTKGRKRTEIRRWNQGWCPQLAQGKIAFLYWQMLVNEWGFYKFVFLTVFTDFIYLILLSLNRLQTVIFQVHELRLLCKPQDQRLVWVIRNFPDCSFVWNSRCQIGMKKRDGHKRIIEDESGELRNKCQ